MTNEEINKMKQKYARRAFIQGSGFNEIDDDIIEVLNLITTYENLLSNYEIKSKRIDKANEYINKIKDKLSEDNYNELIFDLNDYIGE